MRLIISYEIAQYMMPKLSTYVRVVRSSEQVGKYFTFPPMLTRYLGSGGRLDNSSRFCDTGSARRRRLGCSVKGCRGLPRPLNVRPDLPEAGGIGGAGKGRPPQKQNRPLVTQFVWAGLSAARYVARSHGLSHFGKSNPSPLAPRLAFLEGRGK